jgi:hypothetical protein
MIHLDNITNEDITKAIIFYNKTLTRQNAVVKRYYQRNREKMIKRSRENYKHIYSKDPEFLARRSIYFKERYQLKKQEKQQQQQQEIKNSE